MKIWYCVLATTVCLSMIGCRSDPSIQILEQQNRRLEDEIYRLRWALEDCGTSMAINGPTLAAPGTVGSRTSPSAGRTSPSARRTAPAATGPVQVDLGERMQEGESPGIFAPKSLPSPAESAPDTNRMPAPPRGGPLDEAPRFQPNKTNRFAPPDNSDKVMQITLGGVSCGGYDADGKPGDEGIRLVLEPRNARGRILAVPADITVVALDPALQGESARVGRWDFTAREVAQRILHDGRGIRLEGLWPPAPPKHNDLHMFVRYTTRDGRRIETECPIRVALPGEPLPTRAIRPESGPRLQAEEPAGPMAPVMPQVRSPHRPATAARPTTASQHPAWSPHRNR